MMRWAQGLGAVILIALLGWVAWVSHRVTLIEDYQRERVAEWERAMTRWQQDEQQSAEVVVRLLSTLEEVEHELERIRRDREKKEQN